MTPLFQANFACGFAPARYARLRSATRLVSYPIYRKEFTLPVLISSITIVSLLSISVVFIGSFIACLRIFPKFSNDEIFHYSQHYLSLLITLLTVVPMAIAVISALPFKKYELLLLNQMRGVSMCERILLMGVRVFNHVCLTIIPNIILVRREEKLRGIQLSIDEVLDDAFLEKGKKFKQKLIKFSLEMINIGLASICLSLEYIPLWALEISNLPSKKTLKELNKEKQNG